MNHNKDKRKPVILKNLITGEVSKAVSITQFCKDNKLGDNGKYHFADVLKGKRLHHKCWGLNKNYLINPVEVKTVKQVLIAPALIEGDE